MSARLCLAAEHADREARTEEHDRQAVDAGVEEHERELTLADTIHRHPQSVEHPRAHAHAAERPAGHDHAAPELGPSHPGAQVLAATVLAEQVVRVQDPSPGDDVSDRRQGLDRHRSDDPLRLDVLEVLERLLEARDELEEEVDEDDKADEFQRTPGEVAARLPQ